MKIDFKLDFGAKAGMQPALKLVYSFRDRGLENRCFSRGGRQGGFFFCRPPTGTDGVLMACQRTGRSQGKSMRGLQPGSPDMGACALHKVRVTVPPHTHARGLSTVGCGTIRNSVANLKTTTTQEQQILLFCCSHEEHES